MIAAMKWIASILILCACGEGTGTSAECAYGGELTDCDDAEQTVEGACWRLVDCGAIDVDIEDPMNPGAFDWGVCVDELADLTQDRERLVVACITAATCDELHSGQFEICFQLGNQ
jgi:hypothetical protein